MDEEVRIRSDLREREKQKDLEGRVSEKGMFKKIGDILNPLRSARLLASDPSFKKYIRSVRVAYGIGFSAPFIVVGRVIGIISAGAYGFYRLLEKQLY